MTTYSAAILTDTPTAYYRVDETSGGSAAADSSGNGNNGTYNSTGVTYSAAGAISLDADTCITLDGVAGYVTLPAAVNCSGLAAFSVEFWSNLSTIALGTFTALVSGDNTSSTHHSFVVYRSGTASLNFSVGNGTIAPIATYVKAPVAGVWEHVVCTYDGALLRIYQNGVQRATATLTGTVGTAATSPALGSNLAHNASFFPGSLDEVAIYPYALIPAQVLNHYTIGITTQPYSVKIAGSTVAVKGGTIAIDLGLGKRGSADFLVQQPAASGTSGYVPRIFGGAIPTSGGSGTWTHYTQYQPVNIFNQNNTSIFSGYIDTPQEMKPGFANVLTCQITAMDQRWITDKRLIFSNGPFPDVTLFPSTVLYPAQATSAKVYTNRPYDVIVWDIYNTILKQEGVTVGAIFTGPSPSPTLFPSTTLFPNGATQAISSVTFNYPSVTQALDALVKAASANNTAFYWSIDANKQLWFVPYSYVVNNTLVDGTHIDQVQNPPYVTRANPLYRNTQYVEGGIGGAASASNTAQITAQKALDGTSGIVESALKDTNIVTRSDGTIEANQLLNVYCFPGALRFVFTTLVGGYLPGQQITVTYAPFGFNNTKMLIESMHIQDPSDRYDFEYTITAVIGPYDATWAQFFGKILAPSGVSAASSISIGI